MKHPYNPDSVSPPYETLCELIDERGISLHKAAELIGIDIATMLYISRGDIPIKNHVAIDLEKAGFATAEFWEKRTKRYNEWKEKNDRNLHKSTFSVDVAGSR